MKKGKRKPSGAIGPITIRPGDQATEFQPLPFPEDKAELERYIVTFVTRGFRNKGHNPYELTGEPTQNAENDYDFTLPTVSGTEYPDLMEVAPLEAVRGSYRDAPGSYNHGELADFIVDKLSAKSEKYRANLQPSIHLLLYTTDWRFRVTDNVLLLVGNQCRQNDHSFKTIIYCVPDDATHGEAKRVYPLPPDVFKNLDEQAARQRTSIIGDPTRMIAGSGSSFEVPLGPLKKKQV